MTEKNKNEVALFKKGTALAEMPKYDDVYNGAGNEDVSTEDVKTPALYIVQKTGNIIDENPDARPGQIWNNITNECTKEVMLINLGFRKSYVAAEATFGGATLGVFNSKAEAQEAVDAQKTPDDYKVTDIHHHICLLLNEDGEVDMPIEVRFRGTSQQVSREWNSKFMASKTPRFASVWMMSTTERSNAKGKWYVPVMDQVGWVPKEALADLEKKRKQVMGD